MIKRLLFFFLFPLSVHAQDTYPYSFQQDSVFIRDNYEKSEYQIVMRDGVKLFTQVYAPKDQTKSHPILLQRTPYSCRPYGLTEYRRRIGPNPYLLRDGYIVVYQDVRGRYASEGKFVEMTPHLDKKATPKDIDEASDTYDTIDWLVKNIANNNGKVGQWGTSYPGFFASAGALSGHTALKASSPQAPMADLRRDDAFHNGAFMLAANFGFYPYFQDQSVPIKEDPEPYFEVKNPDGYDFFLHTVGTTQNTETGFYKGRNSYYHENFEHPDYDDHWRRRNLLPHLRGIQHAVLVVGGWYDAEDLYGTFHTYQAIEQQNPGIPNRVVIGPWTHGGWGGRSGQTLGDVDFGSKVSPYFQEKIEAPFFRHYLADEGGTYDLPEATVFETGANRWRTFDTYPPKGLKTKQLYLQGDGKLSFDPPTAAKSNSTFVSDPNHPVPYSGKINDPVISSYMVEDQRFASQRPDVLTFATDTLTADLTLAGAIEAMLKVSTTGTDADWVVKVIDVYPVNMPRSSRRSEVVMGGYQQLVRSEIIRGKYRNDPAKPQPFQPNVVTDVSVELQDVLHTFKKGHRVMVQIQSSCFPWADRNPQKFMDIFKAQPGDYQTATHKVYHQKGAMSFLKVGVLGGDR